MDKIYLVWGIEESDGWRDLSGCFTDPAHAKAIAADDSRVEEWPLWDRVPEVEKVYTVHGTLIDGVFEIGVDGSFTRSELEQPDTFGKAAEITESRLYGTNYIKLVVVGYDAAACWRLLIARGQKLEREYVPPPTPKVYVIHAHTASISRRDGSVTTTVMQFANPTPPPHRLVREINRDPLMTAIIVRGTDFDDVREELQTQIAQELAKLGFGP